MADTNSHGTFVWNELATHDVEKAKAFYADTLGWTFQEFPLPDGPYWVIQSGDKLVGGLGGLETGAVPDLAAAHWFAFVEVDDVDARVAAARDRGATVLRHPADVPNVGRVAVLRDPTGAVIGWMTSLKPEASG